MISIIIYSEKNELLAPLCQNIEQTIGVAHEIIIVDKAASPSNICIAYNEAALRTNFKFICYVNEHILFETNGWGNLAIAHLADETVGLIGISGGSPKSLLPEGWNDKTFLWTANYTSVQNNDGHALTIRLAPMHAEKKQVVVIAGPFMCTRREVQQKFSFDELLTEHIVYALDYSIQVFQQYKVFVVFDILIRWRIQGTTDKKWLENSLALSNKWKRVLPLSAKTMSFGQFREHHWNCMKSFIDKLMELEFPLSYILGLYIQFSFNRFFRYKYFLRLLRYIIANRKVSIKNYYTS